ncbi:MAG TPA: FtsX-like permease family protein [Nevskiaceae bacterium]|nr:FtsX-like permease family protein [Nevskiaceae bacterium]
MKYLPLVWASLWRSKPRTILTMLSIGVAFLLFGLLMAFLQVFGATLDSSGADRLITTGKYSWMQMQPVGYRQQIESIPGVKLVSAQSWFGGIYQEEKQFFPQFPSQLDTYFDIYPEILMPEDQKEALKKTRTGAALMKTLADRYGFKIGDKIPIKATNWANKDGTEVWTFDLVGIFDTATAATRAYHEYLLFNHEYFDEGRELGAGTIGWFIIKTVDPSRNAEVARAIDAKFANSPFPTKTDSEAAFNESFISQMANLKLIVAAVMAAVVFVLLMLTGNTMMQSVRERVPELAVLKTIGYTDRAVLWLVLAEALALCSLAAIAGLALAAWIAPVVGVQIPGFASMQLKPDSALLGVALATAIAVIVGMPPAMRAMRLDIVNALKAH